MKNIDYEIEALKLKSLCTLIAGLNPDNKNTMYEVVTVAEMATEIAETIYTAIADEELIHIND